MIAAIGEILGYSVGILFSPVAIVAVILMLMSAKGKSNGWSFLLGYVIGLAGFAAIVLALGLGSSDGGPSDLTGWIKVGLGLLMFAGAWKSWAGRPKPGETSKPPAWMASIDSFDAAKSFGVGFLFGVTNPALTIAAMATVNEAGISTGDEIGALAAFVVIGTLGVFAPMAVDLIMGPKAEVGLADMKTWLNEHGSVVTMTILAVLGASILGSGISILA